jgi:EGF domain-specific O-GlcNAc transferase
VFLFWLATGSLQSWYNELRNYQGLDESPKCDITFDKPVIFMKLDATVNMYHHFCDFVNLWLTQHVWSNFNEDVHILDWDVSYLPHGGFFEKTFEAFTNNLPNLRPKDFEGKVVCFKEAVFAIPPRVRLSLYYNMFLESGCHGSSVFRTFRDVVLRRLGVPQRPLGQGTPERPFRVVFSSRKGTRKVVNEKELLAVAKKIPEISVKRVDYGEIPFDKQLEHSANADIFIGMHGAGLTHGLFLPYPSVRFCLCPPCVLPERSFPSSRARSCLSCTIATTVTATSISRVSPDTHT